MGISRIVKLGLISVVVLFAVVTAMSSLLPSNIIVSRAIDINTSVDSLQHYVGDLGNWKEWLAIDNANDAQIIETGGKKFLQINKTKISISAASDSLINTSWQVGKSDAMEGHFRIITHPQTEIKTVQWAFFVKVKWYPWEKFASIISDKTLATFMEPSLDKLKTKLE